MNYCSTCGSSRLNFKVPDGDNRERFVCDNCDTIFYENPKIVSGCLVVSKDKILLAKRAIEPRLGYWNVPAGFLENGETFQEGAEREVWEETCAKVAIHRLHTIYNIRKRGQIYMLYLAELKDNQFGVGEESLEVQLFSKEEIPWQDIAFTSSVFALKQYFKDLESGNMDVHYGEYNGQF